MPCGLHGLHQSRRSVLRGLGSAGLAAGLGGLPTLANARLFPQGAFADQVSAIFESAGGAALGQIQPFTLTGKSLPWANKLFSVRKGQQVTFLLSGRWYLAREYDLWFEPGLVFFARTPNGQMFSPMDNAGTMQADTDGMVEIARAAGEWANDQGDLWTPIEAYQAADGHIEGVAIVWDGDPSEGLQKMLAQGDPGGTISQAHERVLLPHVTPEGWHNHHSFGEGGVFRQTGSEMTCQTHKNVSILRRDVDLPLTEDLRLDWDWLVEELPSQLPEDQIPTHDYLSIGVEYDDGQDITYLWSSQLPQGHVFRCPLPGWNEVETHVVQRSGHADLGKWLGESRNITSDYHEIIGGSATKAVRVWLLGVSVFQRRMGQCRYRNVSIGDTSAERLSLI